MSDKDSSHLYRLQSNKPGGFEDSRRLQHTSLHDKTTEADRYLEVAKQRALKYQNQIHEQIDNLPNLSQFISEQQKAQLETMFEQPLSRCNEELAQEKARLERQMHDRDTKTDIKQLQEQIDSFNGTYEKLIKRQKEQRKRQDELVKQFETDKKSVQEIRAELREIQRGNLQRTYQCEELIEKIA